LTYAINLFSDGLIDEGAEADVARDVVVDPVQQILI
jgi:hypothetical protein